RGPRDHPARLPAMLPPLRRWRRTAVLVVIGAIAGAFIIVACLVAMDPPKNQSRGRHPPREWEGMHLPHGETMAQLVAPTVRLPATVTPSKAKMADDEEIIGVC